MDENKKITKIVINKEDELTDIVSAILDSQNERIVLTFAEETDLLISPINLKVLLETADENERLLVAQIIKNPTGQRNAALANMSTIDTPQFPDEEVWEKEEENRMKRLNPPKKVAKKEEPKKEDLPEGDKTSDFQKRVNSAIEKNKQDRDLKEPGDDLLITLDQDLPTGQEEEMKFVRLDEDPVAQEQVDLSRVDFKEKTKNPITGEKKPKVRKSVDFSKAFKSFFAGIGSFFKRIPIPNKLKKLAPIIGISIIVLALLVGLIFFSTGVVAKVKIYVEAKEVETEQNFEGDENIKEIDFEEFKIPVKTETVEKARSTNVNATGTAFRGEKATGVVNITYLCPDEADEGLEIPAGTSLTSGGLSYTLDSAASVECNIPVEKSITAIEVGEEYNLAAGKMFAIQGYSTNQVFGLNSSALTGGSKEEYTVLSKADVDGAVEDLKKLAIEEGEQELKDLTGNWKIIEDSITSKVVPDSIDTEVAIGSEADTVNVSIKTESKASYFLNDGFDEGVANLLTEKAKEEKLFETEGDWDLELDEEIEKEISVVESNAEGITIKLTAKGIVKPEVNKESIIEDLKGKNWEEGNEYIQSLSFSEKDALVDFVPEWFPEWLKSFPGRQGGIILEIGEVE
ncbi:MAG: baseplate J/gp47 family protein [Candidatus Dojkabacteria bacterium]